MPATATTGQDDTKSGGRGSGSNGPLERITAALLVPWNRQQNSQATQRLTQLTEPCRYMLTWSRSLPAEGPSTSARQRNRSSSG
jgi:hypothetical protein